MFISAHSSLYGNHGRSALCRTASLLYVPLHPSPFVCTAFANDPLCRGLGLQFHLGASSGPNHPVLCRRPHRLISAAGAKKIRGPFGMTPCRNRGSRDSHLCRTAEIASYADLRMGCLARRGTQRVVFHHPRQLCLAAAVMVKVTANRRQGVPPSDDGFLANVNMGDPEWRGLQEMASSAMVRSLIPGNLDLGGVVARYLVYRGLAETGWPRGSDCPPGPPLHWVAP